MRPTQARDNIVSKSSKTLPNEIPNLVQDIKSLLHRARHAVYQTINSTMTLTYWEIGRRIVQEEQTGKVRAKYGQGLINNLSLELTAEFGKGFSIDNIKNMRRFYLAYPKSETPSHLFTLSWSHYILLTRIANPDERHFYEIEASSNNWTLKELKRQFDTGLFERLSLSRDKAQVKALAQQGQVIESVADLIKDPYILEFVGLPVVATLVEMTLPQDNQQIFASQYLTILPNKEAFQQLLETED
jgi:hypothetical protein